MDTKRFEYITEQYLAGRASEEEEAELLRAIESSETRYMVFRKLTAEWNPLTRPEEETERKWNRVASLIQPEEEGPVIIHHPAAGRRWLTIAAAVAVLFVASLATYMWMGKEREAVSNRDWLSLTAVEGDLTFTLPDGSSIYLRKGAVLRYPETFSRRSRDVEITGEAFFDITHKKEQPFMVNAEGLYIKVLGTSFSVQTDADGRAISVILVEGKVCLSDATHKELAELLPDQQADYSLRDGSCMITEVDSERLTAWRKGIVLYDNAPVSDIVHLIEQTYHVSLSYKKDSTQRFSGGFLKTQPLETVLQQISKLTGTEITLQ